MRRYVVKPANGGYCKWRVKRRLSIFPAADVDAGNGMGRHVQFYRTEDEARKAARLLNGEDPALDDRLVQLERNIEALEQWHHEWCLRHDEDYRALHPGEWCERHEGLRSVCRHFHVGYRRDGVGEYEITTFSGHVLRSSRPHFIEPVLTRGERRRAMRNVVEWVRSQVGEEGR